MTINEDENDYFELAFEENVEEEREWDEWSIKNVKLLLGASFNPHPHDLQDEYVKILKLDKCCKGWRVQLRCKPSKALRKFSLVDLGRNYYQDLNVVDYQKTKGFHVTFLHMQV